MEVVLTELFPGVPEADLDAAAPGMSLVECSYGEIIMNEGEEDQTLALLCSGEVSIFKAGIELGQAFPGQLVGALAFFGNPRRSVTVRTNLETTLVVIDRRAFDDLRRQQNGVAWHLESRVLESLVYSLRETHLKIAGLAGHSREEDIPQPTFMDRLRSSLPWGRAKGKAAGVQALRKTRHFEDVDEASLALLAREMQDKAYTDGELVCRHGEASDRMFLLVEGMVEVLVGTADGRGNKVASLQPGSFFGAASMLQGRPRMASCRVRGDARVLTIPQETWEKHADAPGHAGSSLRLAMLSTLADQLQLANEQLVALEQVHRAELARDFATPYEGAERRSIHDLYFRD